MTVYSGRVIGPKAHVEMRYDRFQSRENQGLVTEPRRVSEYESIE